MGNLQSAFDVPYASLEARHLKDTVLSGMTNLASLDLQASVVSVSDETFGSSSNLLDRENNSCTNELDDDLDGTKNGWQPCRKIKTASVAVELGCPGSLSGVDIDTTGFPFSSAWKANLDGYIVNKDIKEWKSLMSNVSLKKDSHNFFVFQRSKDVFSKVRLTTCRGGSVARLRCYGTPVALKDKVDQSTNVANARLGARIIYCTDERQGNKPSILVEGSTAADGWESIRSGPQPRNDSCVIQLAVPVHIKEIEISTKYFNGNSPRWFTIEGCYSLDTPDVDYAVGWEYVLTKRAAPNSSRSRYNIHNCRLISHIRLTIYPDGGVQQLSIFGNQRPDEAMDLRCTLVDLETCKDEKQMSIADQPIILQPSSQLENGAEYVRCDDKEAPVLPRQSKRNKSTKTDLKETPPVRPKRRRY
ncbi:galactose-binding domain-like protein [Phycomyces nitens]|nr:galactose-binding domain-like protein [Phycomyces nitens]